jgi:nucleoside 2-deoxyribosyltransferase
MIEIKAPNVIDKFLTKFNKKVFLAGTIDLGNSQDWQAQVTKELKNTNYVVFNPRRDNWDNSWKQEEDNENLSIQVNWEIDMIDHADIIVMYIAPGSKSAITLFEYGKYIESGKIKLCCPDGFFRKGNIDIYAKRFNVEVFNTLDELIENLKQNA